MTSKNLFFKLMKEDLKRRIWTIALSVLAFFLCLPVYCTMRLSAAFERKAKNSAILEMLIEHMGAQFEFMILVTIVGAVICAISGFQYLQSKKKTDFYHSIPVRREVLFIIRYINGLLIYLIPYAINTVLCLIAIGANGFLNAEVFTASLCGIGISLLFYTLLYTIAIIAVMMTGNLIISFLGIGVFFGYGYLLSAVKEAFFSEYFVTYFTNYGRVDSLMSYTPLGYYYNTVTMHNQSIVGRLIGAALITVFLFCCSIFLYRKRPSETAGKAMSFDVSKPIIKFLLVVPITLAGAIFCKNAVNGASGWFIFGLILSFLLITALIEIIYHFDIRKAFCNWKHMLINISVIMIISAIFKYDLFRFDSYIPKVNQIKSMAISINKLDSDMSYYELNDRHKYDYIDSTSYELKNMVLTNYTSAYALAKKGCDSIHEMKAEYRADNNYRYNNNSSFSFSVKYVLRNGSEVYRFYRLPVKQSLDLLNTLYVNKEFKRIHFATELMDPNIIQRLSCASSNSQTAISRDYNPGSNEMAELLKIYQSELDTLTLEDLTTYLPTAKLIFNISSDDNDDVVDISYYVYPTFQKTISFLQDHKLSVPAEFTIDDIDEIELSTSDKRMLNATDASNQENSALLAEESDLYSTVTYSDKDKISEIYSNSVPSEYYYNNPFLIFADERIDVSLVTSTDSYGNENKYGLFFKCGSIPDYVIKDLTK